MKQQSTLRSFEFQWKNLSEAPNLLSDPHWRENVADYILDELSMTAKEIAGKLVLDAGCGNGRWSYGFEKLGCEVYGFDASKSGVAYAKEHVNGIFHVANILCLEELLELYVKNSFDLVWCFGVLHHTGNPEKAFSNLAQLVKAGGIIHLYLYGKKTQMFRWLRTIFNLFSFKKRIALAKLLSKVNDDSVHANFDTFSPPLATEHTEEEVKTWCRRNRFSYERVYPNWVTSNDLFIKTTKQCEF